MEGRRQVSLSFRMSRLFFYKSKEGHAVMNSSVLSSKRLLGSLQKVGLL